MTFSWAILATKIAGTTVGVTKPVGKLSRQVMIGDVVEDLAGDEGIKEDDRECVSDQTPVAQKQSVTQEPIPQCLAVKAPGGIG
jgi:hypothetical protein